MCRDTTNSGVLKSLLARLIVRYEFHCDADYHLHDREDNEAKYK